MILFFLYIIILIRRDILNIIVICFLKWFDIKDIVCYLFGYDILEISWFWRVFLICYVVIYKINYYLLGYLEFFFLNDIYFILVFGNDIRYIIIFVIVVIREVEENWFSYSF